MVDLETPYHNYDLDPYCARNGELRYLRIKKGVAFRLAPSLFIYKYHRITGTSPSDRSVLTDGTRSSLTR